MDDWLCNVRHKCKGQTVSSFGLIKIRKRNIAVQTMLTYIKLLGRVHPDHKHSTVKWVLG